MRISTYLSNNNNSVNLSNSISSSASLSSNLLGNGQKYENSEKKLNSLLKVKQINLQTKIFELNKILQDYKNEIFELKNQINTFKNEDEQCNENEVNTLIQQKINNIKEEISKYQDENKILKIENEKITEENNKLNKIFKEELLNNKNLKKPKYIKSISHHYFTKRFNKNNIQTTNNINQIFDLNPEKSCNNTLFD